MSYSYTFERTFTAVHAKQLAAKVATDLKRIQRFYNSPSDGMIDKFETEIVELLKAGYLEKVTYGFQRNGDWVEPTLRYTAKDLVGANAIDDDPGRIRPNANVSGASFYSYLTHNSAWFKLSKDERDKFEETLPFQRTGAGEPGVNGYLNNDNTYSSGGRSLDRSSVKSY